MANKRIGPFSIEGRLGAGGMGVVYRAIYDKNGRAVALKILSLEFSGNEQLHSRFEREVAILKKLKHKHIVQYLAAGRNGKQPFYVMELVDGGSLETLLRRKTRIPWEQVLDYGLQMCAALDYAHSRGVIHRDLKPANLLLTQDDRIKLSDFGIARDIAATALTATGRTVGTYAYMAPEQISGVHPISAKTDLYALGCVLYELLTGETPFRGDNSAQLLIKHLEHHPPRPTAIAVDCPIWLENVILRLLEKDPSERPLDALAVQMALEEVREKVAAQASVAAITAQGGPTSVGINRNSPELAKLLKRKKKRKKKKGTDEFVPFYERAWFLTLCLIFLVLGVTWAVWPLSEEELFARAQPLMESQEPHKWYEAQRKYLEPLLARFPEGKRAKDAQDYIDKIDMDRAEQRAETNATLGRAPDTEAEFLYSDARRYEKFEDRLTALEKYEGLVALLGHDEEARPFVNLARRHIREIEESGSQPGSRVELVESFLERADTLHGEGKTLEARKIWSSVVNLYSDKRELEPQVGRARQKLTDISSSPSASSRRGQRNDP